MDAAINFTIRIPYERNVFLQLKGLASKIDYESPSVYAWTFPIHRLEEVATLLAKPITLRKADIEEVSKHADKKTVNIYPDTWKGKDNLTIVEFPKLYRIITHQKREEEEGKYTIQELRSDVPREVVNQFWSIVQRYNIGKPVKGTTIQEHMMDTLGITRFHRETGSFDEHKFFGNRADYRKYYLHPLKVLDHLGLVRHHKDGHVERLKEEWDAQTTLNDEEPKGPTA